jgi:hypothetical protein
VLSEYPLGWTPDHPTAQLLRQRAIEALRQREFPPFEGEDAILSDVEDFVKSLSKPNATALFGKLENLADCFGYQENLDRRDKAMRQMLYVFLSPYLDDYILVCGLYDYIKKVIDE